MGSALNQSAAEMGTTILDQKFTMVIHSKAAAPTAIITPKEDPISEDHQEEVANNTGLIIGMSILGFCILCASIICVTLVCMITFGICISTLKFGTKIKTKNNRVQPHYDEVPDNGDQHDSEKGTFAPSKDIEELKDNGSYGRPK
jgi:hypothetical protein